MSKKIGIPGREGDRGRRGIPEVKLWEDRTDCTSPVPCSLGEELVRVW